MDLRNSNGIESRNFYFTTVWKLFSKILNVDLCEVSNCDSTYAFSTFLHQTDSRLLNQKKSSNSTLSKLSDSCVHPVSNYSLLDSIIKKYAINE